MDNYSLQARSGDITSITRLLWIHTRVLGTRCLIQGVYLLNDIESLIRNLSDQPVGVLQKPERCGQKTT